MKVFVTGGTGFIGANVVRAHLAHGDQVRCLVRPTSPALALAGLPVERVEASLDDPVGLQRALSGCDAVQAVAGLFDAGPKGPERMRRVHVDGTRNLCEAALGAGVGRLVLCSSSITVGFGPAHQPGDEETPIQQRERLYPRGTPLGVYFDTKLEAEAIARSYVPRGLETIIVNPDYVIGPWDIKPTSGALVLAMARRHVPFYPRGGKCFIDAGDCAQGHLLALERGRPGRRDLLATDANDVNALFALCMEQGVLTDYKALVEKKGLRSLGNAKASNRYAVRLLDIEPDFYDAYLTTGVNEYLLGSLPFFVKWFVRMDKVKGSKKQAFKNLELVAQRGRYLGPFAKILLSIMCLREKQPQRCHRLLQELSADYPENPLMRSELVKVTEKLANGELRDHTSN